MQKNHLSLDRSSRWMWLWLTFVVKHWPKSVAAFLLWYSPFLSTETFSTVGCSKLLTQYRSGQIWTPRYIWTAQSVAVSRERSNKSTTMGGLDILPHGQFPLHVPVLILEFGSGGRNNSGREILLWLGFESDVILRRRGLQGNIWAVSRWGRRWGGKQTQRGKVKAEVKGWLSGNNKSVILFWSADKTYFKMNINGRSVCKAAHAF